MSGREEGAGTVLALALVAALIVAVGGLLPGVALLAAHQRAAAAADAGALAGADVALGVVAGVPCATAARVARADGADRVRCRQDGLLVRLDVTVTGLGLPLPAAALAGPAPAPSVPTLRGASHPSVYGVRDRPPPLPRRRS